MSDLAPVLPPAGNDVMVAALAQGVARVLVAQGLVPPPAPLPVPPSIEAAAEAAARRVIAETFDGLGYDITKAEGRDKLRDDLRHASKARQSWEGTGKTITTGIVSAIVGGFIWLVTSYVKVGK